MSLFRKTSQRLLNLRLTCPVDRDVRDRPVAEIIDAAYYCEDPAVTIYREEGEQDRLNVAERVRREAFPHGGTNSEGYTELSRFAVLRPNDRGELDWRFGPDTLPQLIAKSAAETVTIRVACFRESAATIREGRDAYCERLHLVGPGGVSEFQSHHELTACAVYTRPTGADVEGAGEQEPAPVPSPWGPSAPGPPPITPPDDAAIPTRAVVYNVERATGFWARATNVVVLHFEPNRVREIVILRGIV